MKRGFTLVELSIVLVIVGLLIGGILVGQSLIDSAKVNATAAQIQQFDAGVLAFKAKYKYLPGDAPGFGGDGDGVITYISSKMTHVHGREIASFWGNLMPNQYITSSVSSGVAVTTKGTNKNAPTSKLGFTGSYIIASALSNSSGQTFVANTTNKQNYFAILHPSNAQTLAGGFYVFRPTTSSNSSTTPTDLQSLDNKIDNNIANTGSVISGAVADAGSGQGGIYAVPLATCSSGATYDLTQSGYECTPLIRIGAQGGNPL